MSLSSLCLLLLLSSSFKGHPVMKLFPIYASTFGHSFQPFFYIFCSLSTNFSWIFPNCFIPFHNDSSIFLLVFHRLNLLKHWFQGLWRACNHTPVLNYHKALACWHPTKKWRRCSLRPVVFFYLSFSSAFLLWFSILAQSALLTAAWCSCQ